MQIKSGDDELHDLLWQWAGMRRDHPRKQEAFNRFATRFFNARGFEVEDLEGHRALAEFILKAMGYI